MCYVDCTSYFCAPFFFKPRTSKTAFYHQGTMISSTPFVLPRTKKTQKEHTTNNNSMTDNKKLDTPLVPESILKNKHDLDELKANRAARKKPGNRKVFSKNKSIKIVKPEKFIARNRHRLNHEKRYNRVMRRGMQKRASDKKMVQEREVEVGAETKSMKYMANSVGAKFVFVIRIREGSGTPKSVRKVLSGFRLRSQYEGVFLRYDEDTRKMLHLVEPYIVYGIMSKTTVHDLISRRGHCKVEGKRVPMSNNLIIEENLGDEGIICVEDLVHEICSIGENFMKANSFLWPFRLTAPKSRFEKNTLKYKEGGHYGDKGEAIDEVIRSML